MLRLFCLIALLALLPHHPVLAQGMNRTPIQIEPKTEEFQTALEDFRADMKVMQEIGVRFNVGTRQEEEKWREEWNAAYSDSYDSFHRMLQAGAKEFDADPDNNRNIGNWLFKIVNQEVEEDRFEGILPVLEVLVKHEPEFTDLHRLMSITAVALAEYERGRKSIEYMAALEEATPQMVYMSENLDEFIAARDKEYATREADAKGEPLPRVLIRTSRGDIEVELFENQAPETVANFISLAEAGEYDHQPFGMGIKHFLVQGGGDDVLAPPYMIYGEGDKPDARNFFRGTLGMALSGVPPNPNSAYAQFFFTLMPNPELDKNNYTAFGRVVKGIEVMAALVKIDPTKEKEEGDAAKEPDELYEVRVLSKRSHEYTPNKVK